MFRTIPLHITPGPDDADGLARERAALASRMDQQAHRERAIVAGTASVRMIEEAIADKHLSRVLAGPVPLSYGPRKQRGAFDVLAAVLVVHVLVLGGIIADGWARRGGCSAIAERYIANPDSTLARRAMSRESCYIEDYTDKSP
jgi:hypothetical protein